MADSFMNASPRNVRGGLHCVQSALGLSSVRANPALEARTHLQFGVMLRRETNNQDLAKHHIEQAFYSKAMLEDDVRFEAASALAELMMERGVAAAAAQAASNAAAQVDGARQVLRKAVELSQQNTYWHCRLLFQLASIHAAEKEYVDAVNVLGAGVNFAYLAGASYTRLLFMLSKTMVRRIKGIQLVRR